MHKRLILIATLAALATTIANAQDTGQRVPLGIIVTNWDCPPCLPANTALDAYLPSQGNSVAMIRVHCWWPGPDDPMYLANPTQATFLVENTPTGSDYAPHFWIDNFIDGDSEPELFDDLFEARKLEPAPLEIDLSYDTAASEVHATVRILDPMPAGDYRFYAAITEDEVRESGTNGETHHNQVFRRLYPGVGGLAINSEIGEQTLTVATPLLARWVFDHLRATVYVQEYDSAEVINAATMFLHVASSTAAPGAPAVVARLLDPAPNPFNPRTLIRFDLAVPGVVDLSVYDLAGRRVRTLAAGTQAAGEHSVLWTGDDARGRTLPSGVYLVQLRAGGTVQSQRAVLAR
jgi:hypothetical protein